MKYTFPHGESTKTVNIADDWIKQTKINLNLTTSEAIELWMCDHGYAENMEQIRLNNAAKGKVLPDTGHTVRKAPERKPDETKRRIIALVNECIGTIADSTEVTNIERIVAFAIGDDNYELTLTKKRKPKQA